MVKYALIIAAAALAGSAFAQTTTPASNAQQTTSAATLVGETQEGNVVVSVTRKDGVIIVSMKGAPKRMLSNADMLHEMISTALTTIGHESSIAKAVEAALATIKANIADPNGSADQETNMVIRVKPNIDAGTMDTKIDALIGGTKYDSTTKSTFTADGSVTTTGTLVRTLANGETQSIAANVMTAANGQMNVNGVITDSQSQIASEALTNSATVSNAAADSAMGSVIPDNTIVSSQEK